MASEIRSSSGVVLTLVLRNREMRFASKTSWHKALRLIFIWPLAIKRHAMFLHPILQPGAIWLALVQSGCPYPLVMLTMDTCSHLLPGVTEESVDRIDKLFEEDADKAAQEKKPAEGQLDNGEEQMEGEA